MKNMPQIHALRDTAFQLSLTSGGIWHVESGIRGAALGGAESTDNDFSSKVKFSRPLLDRLFQSFMAHVLCDGNTPIYQPYQTYGFSFEAASVGCGSPSTDIERKTEGIGHSFIYGDQNSIEKLARVVAMPAMRYLGQLSNDGWIRSDSLADPMEALGDWIYVIYEVGLVTEDPNLRRFYRLLLPFGEDVFGESSEILVSFDGRYIQRSEIRHNKVADRVWEAASKREIGFARLGTDLALASRIALDHLLVTDCLTQVGKGFYGKWIERDCFNWATKTELLKATRRVLGKDVSPVLGTISKNVSNGHIESNGKSGRNNCLVSISSYLAWLSKQKKIPQDEVRQVEDAIINEIRNRKR